MDPRIGAHLARYDLCSNGSTNHLRRSFRITEAQAPAIVRPILEVPPRLKPRDWKSGSQKPFRGARFQEAGCRKVRLSKITGIKPTTTKASDGSAASPKRSSRASW